MANNQYGETIKHAVVMHSDGFSGYVVRTAYLQLDGSYWIPNPYQNAIPVRLYDRESAAEKLADKLNAARVQPIKADEYTAW